MATVSIPTPYTIGDVIKSMDNNLIDRLLKDDQLKKAASLILDQVREGYKPYIEINDENNCPVGIRYPKIEYFVNVRTQLIIGVKYL
jgi:hypothetical protein